MLTRLPPGLLRRPDEEMPLVADSVALSWSDETATGEMPDCAP